MGSSQSWQFYLSNGECAIIASTNPFLEQFFISVKNYQGYITSDIFFSKIMNKAVERKISNKVFKLFSEKEKMSFAQMKYYYCALYSINNIHKILFISYLIFKGNEAITIQKYYKRVNYFFSQSLFLKEILLNKTLIDELLSKGSINWDDLVSYLGENYKKKFNDFYFIKQYSTYENNANSQFEYLCCCDNKYEGEKDKQNIQPLYNQMYDQFEKLKEENGGFYPISLLSRYLLNVHVNESIVNYIIRSIQKKTMKNFIDYETFYSLITTLPPSRSQKSLECLFDILSCPNDSIKKNTLIDLIKAIQLNNLNIYNPSGSNGMRMSNTTKSILDNNNNRKSVSSLDDNASKMPDIITKQQFIAYGDRGQVEGIDELKNNIDRISYIPYLFFAIKPNELPIEYACIQNIMGGKTLDQYSKEQVILTPEDTFYAVPVSFWNNYDYYLSSSGEFSIRPIINTQDICSNTNSSLLNLNSLYLRDYYVLPRKLYLFIIKMCRKEKSEIVLRKICYPKKENNSQVSISEFSFEKDNIVTELELVPISVIQLSVHYITLSLNNPKIDQAKEFLSSMLQLKEKSIRIYSRMTLLSEVKRDLMNAYDYTSSETSDLIIFYGGEFIRILNANINSMTFDSININDFCVCLLNTKHETMDSTYFDLINNKINEEDEKKTMNQDENKSDILMKDDSSLNQQKENEAKSMQSPSFTTSSSDLLKYYLALANTKNSCYINVVLQLVYSIPTIQSFIKSKYFTMFINLKKSEEKGKLITFQLHKLMTHHVNYINSTTSNKPSFIEAISFLKCIESISNFSREIQEDAGEFFIFVINQIHQEIKMISNNIPESNYQFNLNLSDDDNISIIWGKEIKNNTSLINSLFLFLNQSTLSCTQCGTENKSCQTLNNLFLPIPKEDSITLSIVLHRLPFKYKVYYNEINTDPNQIASKSQIVDTLSSIKDNMIDNNANINTNSKQLYLSPLATSIPLKITVTMKQKDKLSSVILKLKSMIELDLEPNNESNNWNEYYNRSVTTFIIFHEQYNVFLNINKDLGSNCCNGDTLHVYELLNSNGINLLKEKQLELSLYKTSTIALKDKNIKMISYNIENSLSRDKIVQDAVASTNENQTIIYHEYLVDIKHRYPKTTYPYLFHKVNFLSLGFMADYILINNSKANFTALNLYNYIWEKYSYVLPSSSKGLLWWENNEMMEQTCYPFVLKIIDANKGTCSSCPWFKLCKGCKMKPTNDVIFIPPQASLVVEWCYSLIKSGEIFINTTLTLSYINQLTEDKQSPLCDINQLFEDQPQPESNKPKSTSTSSISIQQCIDLSFQKETLDDPLMCKKCQASTLHSKIDKIVRLPKYLVLTLKRFQQMVYASNIKNKSLIEFPIKDFFINGKLYDLHGVIYHTGSSNIGHYYTIIKGKEGKWVKLNDQNITVIDNELSLISDQAYILIYEESIKSEPSLYYKLIETMMNNWQHHNAYDDFVFEGEPVKVNNKFGVVKNSFFKNGKYVVKVLFDNEEEDFGFEYVQGFVHYYTDKIWKQEENQNSKTQTGNEGDCVIY